MQYKKIILIFPLSLANLPLVYAFKIQIFHHNVTLFWKNILISTLRVRDD